MAGLRLLACCASILLAVSMPVLTAGEKTTETVTLHLIAHVPEKTEVGIGKDGAPFLQTTGSPEDLQLDEWMETYSGTDYQVVCVTHV